MIQIIADGVPVYDSRLEEYDLEGLKTTRGLNVGGTAEIALPHGHPAYNAFVPYRTIVSIYRDGKHLFRGRALYPADKFTGQRTITCEGERCLLRDGVARPYLHQDTPENIFKATLAEYNAQVEPFKRFTVGKVTVTDPNNYTRLESESATSVLDKVDKLVKQCGGFIVFDDAEDGTRSISWLAELNTQSDQVIEFGENLLDFSRSGSNNNSLATGIIPYGAKDEATGKRLTIESVNSGKDYILAEDAKSIRGTIMTTVTWDDVTDPANLLKKATAYLQGSKFFITSLKLTALDLSHLDKSIASFEVGDWIRVLSAPHGVDEYFQLTQLTENLLNPAQSTISLGKDIQTLTQADAESQNTAKTLSVMLADYKVNTAHTITALERTLVSQIEQADGLIRTYVSDTYATKKALGDTESSIKGEAAETYTTKGETTEVVKSLQSEIKQLAGSITLKVTGGLGNTASIVVSVDGTDQTQALDLSEVRKAFANDTSAVTINGGTVTFNSNTFLVNSTNLQVSADGTITATNANLSGNLTTGDSEGLETKMLGGTVRFYYEGDAVGKLTSANWAGTTNRGVSIQLEDRGKYIGFSFDPNRADDDDTMVIQFMINGGLNPGGITEHVITWGTARFLETTTFERVTYFENNLVFYNTYGVRLRPKDSTDSAIVLFMTSDNITSIGNTGYQTRIYGSTIWLRNNTYAFNFYLENNYVLGTRTTDGTDVYALWMTKNNYLYLGSTSYPTYIQGSTLHLGRGESNTKIYGKAIEFQGPVNFKSVNLQFDHAYGVKGTDTKGNLYWILALGKTDNVYVGTNEIPLVLRGTTVKLASSGATVTSDKRRKNSIEVLPDAYVEMFDKLTPSRYKFNDGTSDRYHVGYIAQEVAEALTEAGLDTQDFGGFVDLNKDGEELGLIYTEFIALQHMKIRQLEQRLAALEGVKTGG